ncbi:MAG: outer membrane protein assembly factor BamC [Pseudomonadota bacterium]
MIRFLVFSSVVAVGLLGCSGSKKEQAYVNAKLEKKLELPEGGNDTKIADFYVTPKLSQKAEQFPIGTKLNDRAPVTIIPLGNDVRPVYQEKTAVVWIEQSVEDILQDVESFLKGEKIPFQSRQISPQRIEVETDWVEQDYSELLDTIAKSEDIDEIRNRFRFTIFVPSGERDAKLRINRMQTQAKVSQGWINLSGKEERSIDYLNQFVAKRYQSALEAYEKSSFYQQSIKITMGSNNADEPVLKSSAPYRRTLMRLEQVLNKLGFVIEDRDFSDGLLVVAFEGGSSSGLFASLFGGEEDSSVELAVGTYRFQVTSTGKVSEIKIMNDESEVLPANIVAKLQPVFSEEFARKPDGRKPI